MVPIDHLTDTVAILLRRDGAPQLWLDFGVVLTALPNGFESRQIVNVTGTMQPGPCLHLSHLYPLHSIRLFRSPRAPVPSPHSINLLRSAFDCTGCRA